LLVLETKRSQRVRLARAAGTVAAVVAVACAAGCSSPTRVVVPVAGHQVSGWVEHWGSVFGNTRGYVDTERSPEIVRLPGHVVQVASSNSTQYGLLANGSLYAWGLGTQGQLGNGRWASSATAVRVRFPAGVKIASIPDDVMPFDSALAVDTRGQVWGWGDNGGGELCTGNAEQHSTPVRLPFSQVTALAGASNHALYDAGGKVYTCGQNIDGDLGDGNRRNSMTPVLVTGLGSSPVTRLVASFADAGALLADGTYYDWGYNADGQLGDGQPGQSSDLPVQVPLPGPATFVAQGGSYWGNGQTLVLMADGSLWGWGDDRAGQLGTKTSTKTSTKISTKTRTETIIETRAISPLPVQFHPPAGVTYQSLATSATTSYALATDGTVYAWGASHLGQIGDGKTYTVRTARPVAASATGISATASDVVVSVLIPGAPPPAAP
jgi:alpha-tubulin suppressor-like RCC1 family protein